MKCFTRWLARGWIAICLPLVASAAVTPSPYIPRPVEELTDRLIIKAKKKLPLKDLRAAYEALLNKKYVDSARLANRFLAAKSAEAREFSDYGHWIVATSDMELARMACAGKAYGKCETLSQQAAARIIRILKECPYSPLLKGLQKELGLTEVMHGQAACKSKKWATCRERMEAGFQRLNGLSELGLLRPEHLDAYGQACEEELTDLCEAWYQKIALVFPKGSPELKALIASSAEAASKTNRTPFHSTRVTKSYKAPDLDQADFDEAIALYLDQKYKQASVEFRQFMDEFPRSAQRFRAQYWLAQALTQEQKHEDAKKYYETILEESPLSYYGLLATLALGREIGSQIEASVPLATASDPFLGPQELVRLRRAETLISAQAFPIAAMELKEIRQRESLSSQFLLYLAALCHQAGYHAGSFSLMQELINRGAEGMVKSYTLRLIFPSPYLELIEKNAKENNLDPVLVLSLMKQESSFETSAASSSGAQGLMQLMPTTAQEVFPDVLRTDLQQADTNIRLGTRYLAKLMDRFNGNIVYALAGYNAGPNAADRWIKAAGGKRGLFEFIETIPYKETRDYVSAIIRNYYWYAHTLGRDLPKTPAYFWNLYGPATPPQGTKPQNGSA